jgi:lipopolysaccharide transport system permease protein
LSTHTTPTSVPTVVIQPTRGWASLGLADVWEYRELLYFLLWREVKGRYRQMAFGPLWIIISPLIQMVIFSVLLGGLANLPSQGVPYPIFTYVGLLPWQFFANAVRQSSGSLVSQKQVIAKVYFPRLIIPISSVLSAFVDFAASFVVLLGMMVVYRIMPTWAILALPFYLLLAAALGLAIGMWLAGLAVKYYDVNLAVGFGLDIWKYLTPVVYSVTVIPEQWQTLYWLNPMAVVIEGFRWALLGTSGPPAWSIVVATVLTLALLVSGAFYFRRSERNIVDVM